MSEPSHVSRRALLALPVLAACAGPSTSEGAASGGATRASGPATLPAADVPVGGGAILLDSQVVVTQPTEGDFKAFGSICTHAGCPVSAVTDGKIVCSCHGSVFSIEDGSVVDGPAAAPLPAKTVTVADGQVTVT